MSTYVPTKTSTKGKMYNKQHNQLYATKEQLYKKIQQFCKWCIYDDKSGLGTWREQVEGCTSKQCPLYSVRPMSTLTVTKGE